MDCFCQIVWPLISIDSLRGKSYQEIAHAVIHPYVKESISENELSSILKKTYKNFDHDNVASLS